ncbi:gamma-glutamyl-gamma-aminobutyrate hydrolase [Acinetobacter sp. ANC 4558]|uniref:gamma-glutamyl-gamma-aminobutyrate hydrolase family protein n=1 Tax=Acinetobacter sp. ANC 4558 TaxID=1977876 RepID=UPI000A350B81|nr:gamma-glutamyl-gamma-aminobutyrate hydrolase family protein [Acinetobacter sp. ANC 4558]OTG84131.1 gamma-glutamyl-gamma-aminobutyrate hydrolase [Acinetobacter sp. ANC 4558]
MNKVLHQEREIKPLVAISTDCIERYGHRAYSLFFGYVEAVANTANALPMSLPSDPESIDYPSLIANIDGILLTGSPSNVSPIYYGGIPKENDPLLDPNRDQTILPLLCKLIEAEIPILAICRGLQEINVAWGGTLNTAVYERSEAIDHREGDRARPIQQWYEDNHAIEIVPGGILSQLHSSKYTNVNSLHHQGIEKLGDGLVVEAIAPDGLVEAFSIKKAKSFALAVQWHPEMRVHDHELSRNIFKAFGEACRHRMRQRLKLDQ